MNITKQISVQKEKLILSIIASSLSDAILRKDETSFEEYNSKRSSLFVSILGEKLYSNFKDKNHSLKVIGVDSNGDNIQGEWLLDIVIAKSIEIVEKNYSTTAMINLEWAVESESNTSLDEFVWDFSKLAMVKSQNYIYLHGFNHGTEDGSNNFFRRRLDIAKKILLAGDGMPNSFYFAFWPSPAKPKFKTKANSIWDLLTDCNLFQYNHLRQIHLYKLTQDDPIYIGSQNITS